MFMLLYCIGIITLINVHVHKRNKYLLSSQMHQLAVNMCQINVMVQPQNKTATVSNTPTGEADSSNNTNE